MRCEFCGKKAFMPTTCKYCSEDLCLKCLLPPRHDCKKIDSWKSKDGLTKQLMKDKCVSEKDERI